MIDLESTGSVSFDPFLVLNDSGGNRLQEDNNRGSGNNSRIGRNLAAGVYQVVAMSFSGRVDAAVSYRLTLRRSDCTTESLGALPRTMSSDVLSRTGELGQGCLVSTNIWSPPVIPGAIYTFELTDQRRVRIDLQGLDGADTYLNLYRGEETYATAIDDDAGPGRDAAISRILDTDTYRVEAGGISNNGQGGRYRLTITVEPAESCDEVDLGLAHGAIVRSAEYAASGCVVSGRYWREYREGAIYLFELGESGRVSIDLEGSEGIDTYLVLSRVDGQGGWWWDNDNSGPARDARIDEELVAGRYRLEVSRYRDEQFGRYRLTIDASSQPVPISADTGRIVVRRLSDGRTEFGWLPADSTERVLPDPRFLGANPSAGDWLNSGVVRVNGIDIGRINVRVNAEGGIEFAFTPTDGERILPAQRHLGPNPRVDVWLRSSEISWADSDEE